jgi:hypothetical protein
MNSLQKIALLAFLCCPVFAQSHELAGGGYNYQNSGQGNGVRANLHGWFASAQFDLTSMVSLTAEADNYYGSVQRQSTTQQNFIAGPRFTFGSEKAKIRPPAEYSLATPNANPTHSYSAKVGISWTIWKERDSRQ